MWKLWWGKKSDRDGERAWNRWSIRWQQPLSELTSDCHLLWWNNSFLWATLTTCVCQQQGKLTQALLCLLYARSGTDKGNGAGVGEGRITHTPVNAVIDSCHMSVPALRGHSGWGSVTNRGQQRASELICPIEVGQKNALPQIHWQSTPSRSTPPHKCPLNSHFKIWSVFI